MIEHLMDWKEFGEPIFKTLYGPLPECFKPKLSGHAPRPIEPGEA
jgi:hypothetical protein